VETKLDIKVEAEFLAAVVQGDDSIDIDILSHVEEDFFSTDSYRWLVRNLIDREWKVIAYDFLDQLLLEDIKDHETREKYKKQLDYLYTKKLEFAKDADKRFRTFSAERKITNTVKLTLEAYNRSKRIDFCLRDLKQGISEAENIVKGDRLKIIDYVDTYEDRMERRKAERDNPDLSPIIKTGIHGLDHQFRLKKKMIVDFLAPFKRGKSILLNTVAYSAFLQNYNVCQVVFENSEDLTFNRFDALFTQTSYNRISNLLLSPEEKTKADMLFKWMGTWSNKLKIIKATSNETSVSDIRDELSMFYDKDGWSPDVLVIDYLNIIGPDESSKKLEERLQQKDIFWKLKNFTEEANVLTYVATQSNMEGIKDGYGSGRLKLSSRGKSIDISQGLDLSVAIDQSEVEKAAGILVLSPHFYRHGPILQDEINLDANLEYMTFDRGVVDLWKTAAEHYPL
jgi:hypothetical protein